MTKPKLPEGAFVVIATGRNAKTFTVKGGALLAEAEWGPHDLHGEGPSGSIPPDMTPREIDEATFSKQIAHRLYRLAHEGAYDKLVLVADPDTLGEIRPLLHLEVTQKLVFDKAATLTNSSIADIERSLSD